MTITTLDTAIQQLIAEHGHSDRKTYLRARFDAGLAWVHFPVGLGGLGLSRDAQSTVDEVLTAAGMPDNDPSKLPIGLGMAGPTLLAHGTPEQRERFLRPLWTGEEVWCQLFSEPSAGSDLAGLSTRAVKDGDEWVVNGQKVWTSMARDARWGILIARTDPTVPKHAGLTYFVCDMHAPGVEVRPLRQITGEAEFNEVFLTDVRLSDDLRIGPVGNGWKVTQTTLMNERVAIGAGHAPREEGAIAALSRVWRADPSVRDMGSYADVMRLWVDAEALRLAGLRHVQQAAQGEPTAEGSAFKLAFALLSQAASGLETELTRGLGIVYDDWSSETWATDPPPGMNFFARGPGYRYLRSRANSIEGGSSEIMRNIIAERVLGLPSEIRVDKGVPWKDLPR